jgi:hypothetical protein
MVFLDSPNGELEKVGPVMHQTKRAEETRSFARTISVASTRVPTIFNRTFVFFSMICEAETKPSSLGCDDGRDDQVNELLLYLFTWSSEAKDGGFEFGSNFMSGWMS